MCWKMVLYFINIYRGWKLGVKYKRIWYSFIHSWYFYSASSSPLLLRGVPDYSIDTVSELTRRSATGNCEWRTLQRSLRGWNGIRTCDPRVRRHLTPPLSRHAPPILQSFQGSETHARTYDETQQLWAQGPCSRSLLKVLIQVPIMHRNMRWKHYPKWWLFKNRKICVC